MPFLSKMMSLWKNLFRRQQIEKDLHDELQSWIDETVERKIQEGLSPELARNAAFLEIGGLDRVKALVRQQRVGFGSHRLAGVTMLVVAFLGGVGTTLALMRRNPPIPVTPIVATQPMAPTRSKPLPILEGRVVDEATGQPLPYVKVGLQAMRPTRRYTLTDEDGRFRFVNPSGHRYELEVFTYEPEVFTHEPEVLKQRWTIDQAHFSSPQPPAFTIVMSNGFLMRTKDGDSRQGEPTSFVGAVVNGKGILPPAASPVDSATNRVLLTSEPPIWLQKPTLDVKEEISWRRSTQWAIPGAERQPDRAETRDERAHKPR